MFSAKVYERLQNITYLSSLSKKNIAVMSKPNDYGDVVKFMAQINKEDVIQKIRFKATGCSHFIALLSYFCEIVEGKSVTDALKIKEKDLIKFDVLEESRHHIYPIILDTFALMIKKYRKGVEKGFIEPCEVVVDEVVEKKTTKKEKKVDIHDGLHEILVTRKSKKTENTEDETQVKETKVEVAKTRKSLKSSSIADENAETILKFTKALYKAMDYAADANYDEVAGFVADVTKTDYDSVYAQRGDADWLTGAEVAAGCEDGTVAAYYQLQQDNFIAAGAVEEAVALENYIMFDNMTNAAK